MKNAMATIIAHFNDVASAWAEYRCVVDENGYITVIDRVDCEIGDVSNVYLVDENGEEHPIIFDESDTEGAYVCDEKALMPIDTDESYPAWIA